MNKTVGSSVTATCAGCERPTKHKVVASVESRVKSDEGYSRQETIHEVGQYQIIQCQGCEIISFRQLSPVSGTDDYLEELYPDRTERRSPSRDCVWYPPNVREIYYEVIYALNAHLATLTGIGIRVLLETISKDRRAVGRNLKEKVDNLVDIGVLTTEGAQILHKIRALGNGAAHDATPHAPELLALAIDVLEHLLRGVYVLPQAAKRTFT